MCDYTPDKIIFFKTNRKNPPFYMGFEYEFDVKKNCNDIWDSFYCEVKKDSFLKSINNKLQNVFYLQYDDTADLELTSMPFSWEFYKKKLKSFTEVFKYIDKYRVKAVRDTGFHVHVSKTFFTYGFYEKCLQFLFNNEKFFKLISGRDNCSLENYASITLLANNLENISYSPLNKNSLMKTDYEDEKFAAIRATTKTVEFRLFKGANDINMIHAYLEFWVAFLSYLKIDDNPTTAKFVKYICKNYKLACYLIQKRLKRR